METPESPAVVEPEPVGELVGLPYGFEQWQRVCAQHYGDGISARFCAGERPPTFFSLADLISFLGGGNDSPSQMVMAGLSTGLGARTVTPLNPRAFFVTPNFTYSEPNPTYMAVSFARGEPLVELVANDPSAQTLRFFLIRFHPACESTPSGCNWADLLTPTIESGWTTYTLYDDDTLKNSTLDCLSCHQPSGPGTPKILRMQELLPPWTHWFDEFGGASPGLLMFRRIHTGNDVYAGVGIPRESPDSLEKLVISNGFLMQPNQFQSQTIKYELLDTGTSATWQALYDRAVAGQEIPPPYYADLQTDPAKVDAMISAYSAVMNHDLAREQLPDIRAVFLDAALPDMSIRPKAGLDGRGILVHICSRCHNSRLDQSLTRARFNVDTLDTMSRAEKDLAIERMRLPDSDRTKMPPIRFHELSSEERDLAISALTN